MSNTDGLNAEEIAGITKVLSEPSAPPSGLNYEPMPDPVHEGEQATFGSDNAGLKEAALERAATRDESQRAPLTPGESERPATERSYIRETTDGVKRTDERLTVKPERAARELTEARQQEVDQVEATLAAQAAQEIDGLRAAVAENPATPDPVRDALLQSQAQQQQQPIEPQPQQEYAPEQPGVDPEIARALQNPAVRAALEQEVSKVEATRQAYTTASAQSAEIVRQQLLADFPYLASIAPEQRAVAIELLRQREPAEYARLNGRLQQAEAVYQRHVQAQQQQAHIDRSRFNQYAFSEGETFERGIKDLPPETVRAVKDNAVAVFRDHYGIPPQQLQHLLQTQPWMHAAPVQRMLFDIVKMNVAQQQLQNNRANPIPNVQRPGISQPRSAADDVRVSDLSNRLTRSANYKDAAALLIAKRAAARR